MLRMIAVMCLIGTQAGAQVTNPTTDRTCGPALHPTDITLDSITERQMLSTFLMASGTAISPRLEEMGLIESNADAGDWIFAALTEKCKTDLTISLQGHLQAIVNDLYAE